MEVDGLQVGREAEPSRLGKKKKSVEKLAIPLQLEVNLGGEEVHVAGEWVARGALVHWKDCAAPCQCLN